LFSEVIMMLKILYREDTNKIYFIITHKNIILEYSSKHSKQIYNQIQEIRNKPELIKHTSNYLIAKQIISDLCLIISPSDFFSK